MSLLKKIARPAALAAVFGAITLTTLALAHPGSAQQATRPWNGLQVQAGPEDSAPPQVDPEAQALLDEVEAAYKNLNSATIAGTVALQVVTPDFTRKTSQPFTSSFERPNKFRHQLKNIQLTCDGSTGYAFDQQQKAYLKFQLPNEKQHLGDLPEVVPNILQTQNPSLLFAMTLTPIADLARDFGTVKRLPDRDIDGVKYGVLQFGSESGPHTIQLLVDPKTHLIRSFVLDFSQALRANAGKEVKTATLTVDYTQITPDAKVDKQQFAFAPPSDALDVKEAAGAEANQEQNQEPEQTEP